MHVLGLQDRLPDSGFVSMTEALPMLRAIKDADELARLTAAGEAADAAFYDILEVRFAGRTETDIAADLADALEAHGHSQVEFTVVGSGPNGANPHHELGERVIAEGDMVVLDFGGLMDGYSSDTTRTVHVGEPTDEERAVHEIVGRAQQAGVEAVRPGGGVPGGRPRRPRGDRRRRLRRPLHPPDRARDRTDGPRAALHRRGRAAALEPGMCFSVEPGIYLAGGFGVRIEDIVTVTEDGGRRLNTRPASSRSSRSPQSAELASGDRWSMARIASHAAEAASTAAGTVSTPWSPTRSAAKSIGVSRSRVIAAMPAAAPIATATVGEMSNQTTGSAMTAMPR